MKRIYDPNFKYRPSYETDVRKTFERIRKQQQANAAEVEAKVKPLQEKRKA